MALAQLPSYYGFNFTKSFHSKPQGPTDPSNNKLPPNYIVVVTGAGKGIGYNVSIAYAKAGAHGISISSRTQKDLDKLSTELRKINPSIDILAHICDTTKDGDVKRLAADVKSHFGRVDCVIANAGVSSAYLDKDGPNRRLPVGVIEDDDFDRVININLLGTQKTAKYFVPLLIESKDGPQIFVAITSAASHWPNSQDVPLAYNLSKIAMNRMVESIHEDHGKDGILTFAIHPGGVLTPLTELHSTQKGDFWAEGSFHLTTFPSHN